MSSVVIAVLVYFCVLCALILVIGFVVEKFNYDKPKTDELVELMTAVMVGPFLMLAFPVFCLMRFIYKAGAWIASKI